MTTPLKVLFLASEADPFIKVGGLGDVAGSLPLALQALQVGLDVRLVLPLHSVIRTEGLSLVRETVFNIPRLGGDDIPAQVFRTELRGLTVYFVSGGPISASLKVYDPNPALDGEKYVFFSLAAIELARRLGWRPDVVQANDWHTAAALYALRRSQPDDFWRGVKTVFTIHNLGYMGAEAENALWDYNLPPIFEPLLPPWARHQPMPLGLWSADAIVAVSPSYAEEIQTPEYGYGLETFLRSRQARISGVVNGIDTAQWDPARDPALTVNFGPENLSARAGNKAALQAQFGFEPDPNIPLLAMVTRMDQQKGVDIALEALRQSADQPWQAILLGTGSAALEESARRLEADFPQRICAAMRFDAKLSRQMYSGADIFLMPSRYEPCGLAQMIAMRYGALPLARATGGLRDTIADGKTGFLFTDASPSVMSATLRRALAIYPNRAQWQTMQKNAMAEDFSWQLSARRYYELYQKIVG